MKTLKERVDKYWNIERCDARAMGYEQGFIDATRLAAENAETIYEDEDDESYLVVNKQSILKAIEE